MAGFKETKFNDRMDTAAKARADMLAKAKLRAEAAKVPRLAARFDQLDTDKDGRLSASERPQRMHGKRGGGRGGDRLQALDTDKDGRISRSEANAGNAGFAARFTEMDANKDGYLDRSDRELRMRKERAAFFTGADANRDGGLSRDEFAVEQGARGAERRVQLAVPIVEIDGSRCTGQGSLDNVRWK